MNADSLTALTAWYERLTPDSLSAIRTFYAESCYFKDPFNEFDRREQVETLFADMFRKLQEPRFVIRETVRQDQGAFLVWDFDFAVRGRAMTIKGCSHLKFDGQGRVVYHRDYWDAAEELYEKLPGIGFLIRQLKKLA
ncbi:SnoaL-like protein [Fluviicoccus keumensis]|uniref:SnoaL-like protein n=1 Tax=Fluviicoccus keumensis TaxID=1435465 RepID=A0A4Q7Z668_9GAMM|nr:nuclear transport factor 2 family protein [Fluviicoccus keumensis]RZU45195.1 SnoaL-like protein [Fluviicoccus keumensis]